MKGFELMTERMVMVILVLLIFGALILMFEKSGGYIKSLIDQFCQSRPELCGSSPPLLGDDEIAFKSTAALACAINSVSTASDQCGDEFKAKSTGLETKLKKDTKRFDYISTEEECIKACKDECALIGCLNHRPYFSYTQEANLNLIPVCDCDLTFQISDSADVGCNAGFSLCKVNNFKLPQKITVAEDWIKGYGDPNFLVYWQSFPIGQDAAWNGHWNWVENAADIAFVYWGGGKIFKAAKAGVNKFVAVGARSGKESINNLLVRLGKEPGFELSAIAAKEANDDIVKRVGISKLKTFGITATAGTLALSAYLDSITAKFDPVPNSLLLKLPYKKPVPFPLETKDNPVILLESETGYYSASPCTSNLAVQKNVVICDSYGWNYNTGLVSCLEPSIKSGDEIEENNKCKNTKDMTEHFTKENNFVPKRINELDTKEELRILQNIDNGIIIRDPVTGFLFEYEDFVDEQYLIKSVIKIETYKIKKILFESSGGKIEFQLDDEELYEDDKIIIGFEGDEKCLLDAGSRTIPTPLKCGVEFSLEVKDSSCTYCNEMKRISEKFNSFKFTFFKEQEVQTGNKEYTIDFTQLETFIDEDRYKILMRDNQQITESGVLPPDGIADMVALDKLSWLQYNILYNQIPEKVVLRDTNSDGVFDTIDQKGCKIEAIIVSQSDKVRTEEKNFCHAEKSFIHLVLEWSPEIGTVVGGTLGGLGFIGGPAAAGTIPAGALIGSRVGAVVFTIYRIKSSVSGTPGIWPGIVY